MPSKIVMTFIGADRPGLLEVLSRLVSDHQGNWLESRMLRLAGKFAGVAELSLPSSEVDTFLKAAAGLNASGLQAVTEVCAEENEAPQGSRMKLAVVGHDRPGIVREFSSALASSHINVIELESAITSAPMTGGPLFTATASICLPEALDIDALCDELEAIANELTVEYTLEEEH